jgi:hypothetical protein
VLSLPIAVLSNGHLFSSTTLEYEEHLAVHSAQSDDLRMMKHSLKKNRKRVKSPSVPTEDDWGDYKSDLDQNHAHSVFAGHTNAEMQPFFRRNPLAMTDDLRWMPDVPFRYYILGFRDFITADQFDFLDGSDAANCFLGLVLEKLENDPRFIVR